MRSRARLSPVGLVLGCVKLVDAQQNTHVPKQWSPNQLKPSMVLKGCSAPSNHLAHCPLLSMAMCWTLGDIVLAPGSGARFPQVAVPAIPWRWSRPVRAPGRSGSHAQKELGEGGAVH